MKRHNELSLVSTPKARLIICPNEAKDLHVKPRPANNTPGFLLPSAIRQIILAPRNRVSVRGTYRLRISTINQRPC